MNEVKICSKHGTQFMKALAVEDDKFLREQETACGQFHRYVRLHYGNLTSCTKPLLKGNLWEASLTVTYPTKGDDDQLHFISFTGLGKLIFDKSLHLIEATTQEQLLATLSGLIERLCDHHKQALKLEASDS